MVKWYGRVAAKMINLSLNALEKNTKLLRSDWLETRVAMFRIATNYIYTELKTRVYWVLGLCNQLQLTHIEISPLLSPSPTTPSFLTHIHMMAAT